MANLETLELTINGSATSASQGIDKLITSLSSLSEAIVKPYSDLVDFNTALKKMRDLCNSIKMPNLAKVTGAARVVSSSKKSTEEILAWQRSRANERTFSNGMGFGKGYQTESERREKNPQWYLSTEERKAGILARNEALKVQEAKQAANAIKQETKAIQESTKASEANKEVVQETVEENKNTISTLGKLKQGFNNLTSGFSGMFGKIKRIATTMLIRSAIRGLIKDIKEGRENLYQWSKLNNGEYAKSIDTLKSKSLQLKNTIGATIAPLVQAAIPVLKQLTDIAIDAFNWVNQLFSLLTGQSYWTKAAEGAGEFEDATKGAGNAAKDWLASWDELNVMNSAGGSGSANSTATDYSDMFENVTAFNEKIRDIATFLKDNVESIKDMAIATGTAILGWKLGTAFADVLPTLSTIFGYVSTGAVIAITLQATWMLTGEYLDTGKEGWLFASALATGVGSTAAWAIAKKLIGGQAGTYAAAIALELSAITDIIANIQHSDVSALSEESILTNVKAAIEGGIGIGLLAHASGAGLAGTLAAAGGGALIIFGVAMGLKTIFDKTNTEWDSQETIIGALTSAIPVGLGLFVLGAGAIPAGIAAIATFGVVIAIKAMMPKDKVTWGDISLTDEEVQAFVEKKMFTVDVKTTVKIIADQLDFSQRQQEFVKSKLSEVIGQWNIIKLGLADSIDYSNLNDMINGKDGLIEKVTGYVDAAKEEGKLTLQFTPTLVGDTSIEQGTWFTDYNMGWDTIQSFVESKGQLIGQWLTEQESKEIKDAVPDVVAAAMEQLTAVTQAIAQAKIGAEAFAGFEIRLGDLDEKSFRDVIDKFNEYKKELTDSYGQLVKDQYIHQQELVEALKITLGDDYENDPTYQKALADLKKMGENMSKAVEDGVNSAIEPGKSLIKEWIEKQFSGSVEYGEDYWQDLFERQGLGLEDLPSVFRNILEQNLDNDQIELADLVGFTGWDIITEDLKKSFLDCIDVLDPKNLGWLNKVGIPATDVVSLTNWNKFDSIQKDQFISSITAVFGEAGINAIKSKIPNISANHIVSVTDWSQFEADQALKFLNAVKTAFSSKEALDAAKASGVDVGKYIDEGLKSNDPEIVKIAQEWNKLINKEVPNPAPEVAPVLKDGQPKLLSDTLKKAIEDTQAKIDKVKAEFENGFPECLGTQVNGVEATVDKIDAKFKKDNPDNLGTDVSKVSATVSDITASFKKDYPGNLAKVVEGVQATVSDITSVFKKGSPDNLKTSVEGVTGTVSASAGWKKDNPGNLGTDVEGISPTVTAKTQFGSNALTDLVNLIQALAPVITIATSVLQGTTTAAGTLTWFLGVLAALNPSVEVDAEAKFKKSQAKSALAAAFAGIIVMVGLATLGTIEFKANGGFVDSGDIFVANENGNAEMIGSFGNHTAVANSDQIVAGIAAGVSNANEEQNTLLRQQNELLRGILAKDASVKLGASAALGRTVQQSLNMYGIATGGA